MRFSTEEALSRGWISEAEARKIKAKERQFEALIGEKKKHKYNAQSIEIDGHKFPSLKEGNRYCELKLMLRAGEIQDLALQPRFTLEQGRRLGNGKWLRKREYIGDFGYWERDKHIVEDTKGYRTREYIHKIKEAQDKYPEIEFREI